MTLSGKRNKSSVSRMGGYSIDEPVAGIHSCLLLILLFIMIIVSNLIINVRI